MKPVPRSLILLGLLLPLTGLGQSYEWFNRNERTPGVGQDQVAGSEQGVYAVGSTCANARCDGYLAKYRAEDGRLQWQRQFSVDRSTTANAVDVNGAGVFVAGATGRDGANPAYFVRLYSHDGDVLWTRNFEPQGLRSTIVADDNGAFLGSTGPDAKCVVRRMSSDGQVLWTHNFPAWTPCNGVAPGDGELYVTVYNEVNVLRAKDGQWLRSFPTDNQLYVLAYHAGFLYLRDHLALTKYSPDGDKVWRLPLDRLGEAGPFLSKERGLAELGLALSDDGLLVPAEYTWPIENEGRNGRRPLLFGHTLIKVGFDGTITGVTEFLGHEAQLNSLTVQDGAVYASGGYSYVARYSTKPLSPPSLLSLTGATPAMPPRLALLYHDYGAGPVRVAVRDAAPGSLQYRFRFSDGLTPVSFGKAADLNSNGYEELVVVSQLPAVAEVRDSLDGSLVSTIELGAHLEPLVATVDNRDGTSPRLAVAVRNRHDDSLLLRVFNLENGALIASNSYHPGFDPVDVAALPDPAGSDARRYALLARNRVAGEPNKIELRSGDGELLGNYWLGSEQDPVQLAVSGGGADGLAVLRYAAASSDLDVLRIDLAAGDRQRVRFSPFLAPVAMLELPDTNGNGYPQYTVFGEETGRKPIRSSVKAETRDLATQALDHYVYTGREYRPQNAVYVGAVPGFSDSAFALLGYRPGWHFRSSPDNVFRVTLTNANGTKLFDLRYSFD